MQTLPPSDDRKYCRSFENVNWSSTYSLLNQRNNTARDSSSDTAEKKVNSRRRTRVILSFRKSIMPPLPLQGRIKGRMEWCGGGRHGSTGCAAAFGRRVAA